MNRPKYHFTPKKGWINDPNGTIFLNGEYHLFYQHYPEGLVWGPMHWGHATSKDLINWEHKEIALFPDELGYIFSGSCIYDEENVSGLGDNENKPLIAFYTSHNPETGEQQQSIAYSYNFEHFTKYEKNPIISNLKYLDDVNPLSVGENRVPEKQINPDYQIDFRDPKVFKNPVKGGYSMVLAAGRKLEFFHSLNLIDWKKTGEFNPSENGFGGICECPDCFCLEVNYAQDKNNTQSDSSNADLKKDGAKQHKWILSLSNIIEDDKVGKSLAEGGYPNAHVMQYFVGEFNGDTFIDTEKYEEPLVLDYGTDNYAMVTFANSDKPLMIGWGEHWDYAATIPALDYRGKMTLIRSVKLVDTKKGYRLQFVPEILNQKIQEKVVKHYNISIGDEIGFTSSLKPEMDAIKMKATQDKIVITRNLSSETKLVSEFFQKENYNKYTAKRILNGNCEITVIEDEGYFEIFADSGFVMFSIMTL